MSPVNPFSSHLAQFDNDWLPALAELAPDFHPVDSDAVWIWFQFYPLSLLFLTATDETKERLEAFYQLRGAYRLADVAQTSHNFLYSHRYWPDAKRAVVSTPLSRHSDLVGLIRAIAAKIEAPAGLALPISAIAVMTVRQIGSDFLRVPYTPPADPRSAEKVLNDRATDAKGGFLSRSKPRVIFNESKTDAWFPLIPSQHITAAAEQDKRPHHESDERCYIGNGPIPVDCRSGTCGTCWVGILGGNELLDKPDTYERERMEYFGYWETPFHQPEAQRPLIRLACQTIAQGSCSIVIPPWNGVWGKSRREAWLRRRG